jgi:hypothetical protein
MLKAAYRQLREWGFDPGIFFDALAGLIGVKRDYHEILRQRRESPNGRDFEIAGSYFIFKDKTDSAGVARGHYFWQDLLVAREIYRNKPLRHIDVGSSVLGFVSHVASFREIEVIDIRPLDNRVPGINFTQADITKLDPNLHGVADSVSCLHTLEHMGLGRYGDTIDFDGWARGFDNLTGLLSPGGKMYLSVPTGVKQRVVFNAHRVFSLPYLREFVGQRLSIDRVVFLDDHDQLFDDVDLESPDAQNSFDADYGLSIWFLSKPAAPVK